MDSFLRIAIIASSVFLPCLSKVELLIEPAGEIKQGVTVNLVCTKQDMAMFDVLKIRKHNGGTTVDVLISKTVQPNFLSTGRYFLGASTDISTGRLVAEIKGITGQDRGEFECYDSASKDGAIESIDVLVPPKSVKIMAQTNKDSPFQDIVDGADIIFTTGSVSNLKCEVIVEGSKEMPMITAKIGDEDVVKSTRFDMQDLVMPDNTDANGFYQGVRTTTVEENRDSALKDDDGKPFTCSANMRGYDTPLSSHVNIKVHYPPDITCEQAKAEIDTDYKITCRASMNPVFTSAVWSWDGDQLEMPDAHSQDGNIHFMHSATENSHTFQLHIKNVRKQDFQQYKLAVSNGVATEVVELVTLEEEEIPTPKPATPTPTKSTTIKAGSAKPVSDNNPNNSGDRAIASFGIVALVTFYLFVKLL